MSVDFAALKEDGAFTRRLDDHVWLMDDHRWAICAWEEYRLEAQLQRLDLVHVDYHWDSLDDYQAQPEQVALLLEADLPALRQAVGADKLIRFDSFIAPAVRRGLLREIHFLCRQDDGEPLDEDILVEADSAQCVHENLASLAALQLVAPYIFDLCLDYFCDSVMEGEGPVWSDARVVEVIDALRPLVQGANAVTVSLSFRYSGTADDTRHLAELVVRRILQWRHG